MKLLSLAALAPPRSEFETRENQDSLDLFQAR
jgi:hypothetical protein